MDYVRMSAFAYLYDNLRDFPTWFRKLTPGQLQDISSVMSRWQYPDHSTSISTMEDIERREVLRVIALFRGNVKKAATALDISQTTIYRKLSEWGHTLGNQRLQMQASVLAGKTRPNRSTHGGS
jgi:transcriptional regulator with GAF, ATPase, and Fis domain